MYKKLQPADKMNTIRMRTSLFAWFKEQKNTLIRETSIILKTEDLRKGFQHFYRNLLIGGDSSLNSVIEYNTENYGKNIIAKNLFVKCFPHYKNDVIWDSRDMYQN